MLVFPESFLEPDGRFRDVIPADFVPVMYITVDGEMRCAGCMNGVSKFLDPFGTDERGWSVVDYELLYEGPPIECSHCRTPVPTLYGESTDGLGDEPL
jgi:hypothetical protein